jgi:extradiol dioxygenase family protein
MMNTLRTLKIKSSVLQYFRCSSKLSPFHLAIPVHDMAAARNFYGGVLNLVEGRRSGDKWQDYSLFVSVMYILYGYAGANNTIGPSDRVPFRGIRV